MLNPHTLPLVPYPGLAPELDIRSGMGQWDAYALEAPNDRFLPFLLSRRMVPSNAKWINCIWVEHADTGARIQTLLPTGATPAAAPSLGVLFTKLVDTDHKVEHFTYNGAPIADLSLPCGVPLRLIVDNAYQSARFVAIAPAADMPQTHFPLEWYHNGPLHGVPYGRGFRQRFYLRNGSLQPLDAREEKESTKDPNGGPDRLDSLSVFAQKGFVVDPVPAFLTQAFQGARAAKYFLADNAPWQLASFKATPSGIDGGRWSMSGTLEDLEPLLRMGCQAPALDVEAFDPLMSAPRGWRCGDTSDTAPDAVKTGAFSCQLDDNGRNTGYVEETLQDLNPNSATYGQISYQLSADRDLVRCPVPTVTYNTEQTAYALRNNCGPGYVGSQESVTIPAGTYSSTTGQQAANDQALAAAQVQAQDKANSQGTCTLGKTVTLLNVGKAPKFVRFDLRRSDAVGGLQVTVYARAMVDNGSIQTQETSRTILIPDGSTSLTSLSISFGGATILELNELSIQSTLPSDYSF